MSFLFRALFVVGLIYLLSPLRADLPDWLVNPSPEAARDVMPVLAESAADAVASTCQTNQAACASAAVAIANKAAGQMATGAPGHDAQAAFEALVRQAANMPSPAPDTMAAPSIPTLIEKPAATKPKPVIGTETSSLLNLTTIPLPPRRKI